MRRIFLTIGLALLAVIAFSQNVGIGITTPVARLHVSDSNVVFTGPATLPFSTTFNPPVQGPGSRMMWYPQKAAFRVGFVQAAHWNTDSIGKFSVAAGFNTKAKGEGSIALGYDIQALGDYSTAMGDGTTASGYASTAMGFSTNASGLQSTAMGYGTIACSDACTAMGYSTIASGLVSLATGNSTNASGYSSTAMGYFTIAAGSKSTAMGQFTTASGNYSTAMGESTIAEGFASTSMGAGTQATGAESVAMGYLTKSRASSSATLGYYNIARSDYSLVIGRYNDTAATNRLFEIGNGTADYARSNAMTVLQNGNIGIGTTNPNASLQFANTVLIRKIVLYETANNDHQFYGLGINSGTLRYQVDGTTADHVFFAGTGSTTSNELMRIRGNGNVGIGNAAPTVPLSFGNTFGTKISLYHGTYGDVGIGIYGGELRLQNDIPNGKVSLGVIETTGTFTELAKAEHSGAYAFSIFGSLWANGTTYASDERFKQNITPISSPLQKLLQINGVEYEMKTTEFAKNNFQKGRQIGLIAQNVEKVIPEAVNELDGYKGVDYAKLVPLLVESIKEQQKQIEELKKQNEEILKLLHQKN